MLIIPFTVTQGLLTIHGKDCVHRHYLYLEIDLVLSLSSCHLTWREDTIPLRGVSYLLDVAYIDMMQSIRSQNICCPGTILSTYAELSHFCHNIHCWL